MKTKYLKRRFGETGASMVELVLVASLVALVAIPSMEYVGINAQKSPCLAADVLNDDGSQTFDPVSGCGGHNTYCWDPELGCACYCQALGACSPGARPECVGAPHVGPS